MYSLHIATAWSMSLEKQIQVCAIASTAYPSFDFQHQSLDRAVLLFQKPSVPPYGFSTILSKQQALESNDSTSIMVLLISSFTFGGLQVQSCLRSTAATLPVQLWLVDTRSRHSTMALRLPVDM